MGKLIRVKAKREHRRDLARWARQFHGVRMVSSVELGFPPDLFPDIPEHLLVDSLIDGRPYHLAQHVPSPNPPAKVQRRETPGAAAARNRAQDEAADAVAPRTVAHPANVVVSDAGAGPAASAEVTPAVATTATATVPVEATETDPTARARTHHAGDGCQPPHLAPDSGPSEATLTVDVDQVEVAGQAEEMPGAPGPAVNLDTGVETPAGEPLPELPESAHPPGTVPLDPPPVGRRQQRRAAFRAATPAGRLQCPEPDCSFATGSEHGLAIHKGRAHNGRGGAG